MLIKLISKPLHRQYCGLIAGVVFSGLVMAEELRPVNAEQLQTLQQTDNALIVDIRTAAEWQASGIIPNSHKLEFFHSDGSAEPEQWLSALAKLKTSPDQPVILVCRSGNRSSKAGQLLIEKMGVKNLSHLAGGIQSWAASGKTLQKDCLMVACK